MMYCTLNFHWIIEFEIYFSGESENLEVLALEVITLWNNCREQLISFSMHLFRIKTQFRSLLKNKQYCYNKSFVNSFDICL